MIPDPWHHSSTHPESWYLKHVLAWRALGEDMNMSPRLTKRQALTKAWLEKSLDRLHMRHFMAEAKPMNWLSCGAIPPLRRYARYTFDESNQERIHERGREALHRYLSFASMAIVKTALASGWRSVGLKEAAALRSALSYLDELTDVNIWMIRIKLLSLLRRVSTCVRKRILLTRTIVYFLYKLYSLKYKLFCSKPGTATNVLHVVLHSKLSRVIWSHVLFLLRCQIAFFLYF